MYAQAQPTGDADLASIGALLAEPARAKVLLALSDGRSLPASMLASEAGVAASTVSRHLAQLVDGGLIAVRVTDAGARRFAELGFAAKAGDQSRSCRDWTEQRSHVAAPLGRELTNGFLERGWLEPHARTRALRLTAAGVAGLRSALGVSLP